MSCTWKILPEPYGMMATTCDWTVEPPTVTIHGRIIGISGSFCHHCGRLIEIPDSDRWHDIHGLRSGMEVKR